MRFKDNRLKLWYKRSLSRLEKHYHGEADMSKGAIFLVLIVVAAVFTALLLSRCDNELNVERQLSTSVVPSDGGTVSPSNGLFKGTVTLIATPNEYYEFVEWGGAASGSSNPLKVKMNSDKQIVARFAKKNYELQTSSSNGGTVEPSGGVFEAGTQVGITAVPDSGYGFDYWGGDASGTTNPVSILMDRDKAVTAQFVKVYSLTTSCSPDNCGTISPEGGIYKAGTTVEISATPLFPYCPKNWIGADDNNAFPGKVTMNNDAWVTLECCRCTMEGEQTASGAVSKDALGRWGDIVSIPIQLNQFDWVQGELYWQTPNTPNTPIRTYIQDPLGNTLRDFGSNKQANFTFMAQNDGRHNIVLQNNSIWYADYHLTYTICICTE